MSYLKNLSYALSNSGYVQDIEREIIEQNPTWNQAQIDARVQEVRENSTLFNRPNKKAYTATVAGAKGDRLKEIQALIRATP